MAGLSRKRIARFAGGLTFCFFPQLPSFGLLAISSEVAEYCSEYGF
jgi:hypothetical protein